MARFSNFGQSLDVRSDSGAPSENSRMFELSGFMAAAIRGLDLMS